MSTVPGTHFTKEQLKADLKIDNVTDGGYFGSNRLNHYGFVYDMERKQYDKALAWYLLAAKENNFAAHNNIGSLYRDGSGIPKNYLCAMKWYLKSAEQLISANTAQHIGNLFGNGQGVPVNKYKALEWYRYGENKVYGDTWRNQGYHFSIADKIKPLDELINETKAILDAEKKILEKKRYKTQKETETLRQLDITYKLTDGRRDAWSDIPILLLSDDERHNKDELLELKKQIQHLEEEMTDFKLRIKRRDSKITSLKNDVQSLQRENSTAQHQLKTSDSEITSLKSENNELMLKIHNLEYQVQDKDSRNLSFQTENQSLKQEKAIFGFQMNEKNNKINLLEIENRKYRTASIKQGQKLDVLLDEKTTLEQTNEFADIEIARLKSSNTTLKQSLKSMEDTIVSLNRENQTLSAANQANQRGTNEMMETLKTLLQTKTNQVELPNQRMERSTEQRRKNGTIDKRMNTLLNQEDTRRQSTIQNTSPLLNDSFDPKNIGLNHLDDPDDARNDINYDTECDDSEECDDDITKYDTPSEDGHN